MSNYYQLYETLNHLQKLNDKLKESIDKYDSGEMESILRKIKELNDENDFLQLIINKKYKQLYNQISNEPIAQHSALESPTPIESNVNTPPNTPVQTPANTPSDMSLPKNIKTTVSSPKSEKYIEQVGVFPFINLSKIFWQYNN